MGGGIFGPSEFLCPGEVGSKWTYYATATNEILDGGDNVSLKCKGTYECPKVNLFLIV